MQVKHGGARAKKELRHPLYKRWCMMRDRCQNPKNIKYQIYGGTGIIVCERWQDFEKFVLDVGLPPGPGYSLDRYPDPSGNYEPDNVRWATAKEQRHNRRSKIKCPS
jgi:hypothetical protein